MSDKLLIEIDMVNGDAEDAVRALVFLANEIVESPTIEIVNTPRWKERTNDLYQLKWRFTEDACSSWQLNIGVELALQINDALRVAESELDKKIRRKENTPNPALEAIKKAQQELCSYLAASEPELCSLIAD